MTERASEAPVAIVTGAAGGIGQAIATRLGADGFRVCLADVDEPGANALASRLGIDRCLPVAIDITDQAQVERLIDVVDGRWGRIDMLVNNAGRTRVGPFAQSKEEHWRELFELDVSGLFRCTQLVLGPMLRAGSGRIVNLASDAARVGLPGQTVYAAAKGAVLSFTRSLARELGAHNILVNAVSPGPVNTAPLQRLFSRQPELERQLLGEIPIGRVAEPEEVAAAISFLGSDDARYITGQVLSVNGGWTTA